MNTVDLQQIENFRKDSNKWWDINGPFKPLHRLNPLRIGYIRDQIKARFDIKSNDLKPLNGIEILDIGCGGGIVCEPLTRLGAKVTGIDADEQAIDVATSHARENDLKIKYICGSSEDLADKKKRYDVVLGLEIIEHVSNPQLFMNNIATLCKDGGLICLSTLNRTMKSYALGIIAAEYILRWVPQGTHDWEKFIKPSEMAAMMRENGILPHAQTGITFNPLHNEFSLSDRDLAVNYIMCGIKPKTK